MGVFMLQMGLEGLIFLLVFMIIIFIGPCTFRLSEEKNMAFPFCSIKL